jgi:hypothetical protein
LIFDSEELFDPPLDDDDNDDNAVCGKVAINYLAAHLPGKGIQTVDSFREDWGWVLKIDNPEFSLYIGCGFAGTTDLGLNCFTIPDQPRIWHWFGRQRKRQRIQAVKDAVEKILRESGKVSGLHWLTEP